jgi:hypothetical protein
MPRCPECGTVVDTTLAAGTAHALDRGRCPTHGLITVTYFFACNPDESAGQA